MKIRFGTDGWRAVIGREFTFANLRRVVQAVCEVEREDGARHVAIGYDNRFLARRFAEETASVVLGNGLTAALAEHPTTTPAVSCQVVETNADFGLVLTASHNPPEFHGLKIKTARGASAGEELTSRVETYVGRNTPRQSDLAEGVALGKLEILSFSPAHEARLLQAVDLRRIQTAGLQVVVDSMHGTGGQIIETLVADCATKVRTLRAARDPLFGGQSPEPVASRLTPLLETVRRTGASLGFATDGDGDRISAVDDHGEYVSPLRLVAVLALHQLRQRKVPGGVAKTFANTIYLDRIAAAEGRPFHCLPVGFKHAAALLEKGELAIGGEESGGIGFAGYLPERDGLLAGLLLMEAVAVAGKPLSGLLADLVAEFGDYHYDRVDLPDPEGRLKAAVEAIALRPPERIAGVGVESIDTLDGVKLLLGETGWLLFRGSGTEPILRIYAEATPRQKVAELLREGRKLVETTQNA